MKRRNHTAPKSMEGKRKPCRPKTMHLVNGQGRGLTVILREYRPGEEEGMIACIRDEYGDSYFKRNFYDPAYIREEAKSNHITFLVAQTKAGEIAGMLILKEFYPEENMCEIASQIFRKKYRGYGLAQPFFAYAMKILLGRNYYAAYCLPVLFHDTTQRLLYRQKLRATGFVLNVFDMTRITHSYKRDRNRKHSQGIQIRAVQKRNAGKVYLPAELQEFGRSIYETLGVTYSLAVMEEGKLPENSKLFYRQDNLQSSLEVDIYRIGADLPERLATLHEKFPMRGMQTANVFLSISDENAVWAYKKLTEMGYFFTGLKPLCSKRELMVLHQPGEVAIFFEDYVLSEEFEKLAEYITQFYNKQKMKKI